MNDLEKGSILGSTMSPFRQAGLILGVSVLVISLAKVIKLINDDIISDLFPWMIASAFMLFFALLNSVLTLSTKNLSKYWNQSIPIFFGTLIVNGLIAYLFSGIWIKEAGSYQWIMIVVSIGYLVFLSLMTFVRRIVEFAMKEEWNQPRARKRN